MIYLRLAGGLGNQLFQLACALHLRAADEEPILLATDALGSYKTPRRPDVQAVIDLPALKVNVGRCDSRAVSAALAMRLPRLLPMVGCNDRNFDPGIRRRPERRFFPTLVDGYFQSQWNWPCLSEVLRPMAAATVTPPQATSTSQCVVHVRGTDFLKSSVHAVIGDDYYVRALRQLRSRHTIGQVAVITDDPDYAMSVLATAQQSEPDLAFSFPRQPASMLQDFLALRDAGSRIIPNSTFSWWAAALDRNKAPTVSPDLFVHGAVRQPSLPWETAIAAT